MELPHCSFGAWFFLRGDVDNNSRLGSAESLPELSGGRWQLQAHIRPLVTYHAIASKRPYKADFHAPNVARFNVNRRRCLVAASIQMAGSTGGAL